jgi:hypothetical protein
MKFLNWADVVVGVLLIASPLALGSYGLRIELAEQIVPGVFLIATAAWILVSRAHRLRLVWLQALDGLWLIVGSFAMLFSGLPRIATGLVAIGLLVLVLSLITSWTLTRTLDTPLGGS